MIIEIATHADAQAVADLCDAITSDAITAWPVTIGSRRFVAASGDEAQMPAVESPIVVGVHSTAASGYWLADRVNGVAPASVTVGDFRIGDGPLWCAAGPCALEDFGDAVATGLAVWEQGAHALRIGVFKPRTSPYNFQGKQVAGIKQLPDLKAIVGLPVVTEVLDPRDVEMVAEVADCLQVGTRNMTNQALLKELGTAGRPVLLKRGYRTPVEEWLRAAEFVMAHGNPSVILCARGISSFDTSLRYMPDFGAVLAVRQRTNLPVVFDPSHSAGRLDAVAPVALAAAACGVDGLLVEAHIAPERMYQPGDAGQAYDPARLGALMRACATVRDVAASL